MFQFRRISLVLFVFSSYQALAQNNVTEQVEVKRQYKPVLGESLKIRKSPYFPEESPKAIQPKYGFKDISLKKDTAANSIQPDSLNRKDTTKVLPIYMQAGAGNHRTIMGDIFFNTLPSPTGSLSANFRHLSLEGKLANQKFSSDQINLDGKKILTRNYLSAHLGVEVKSDPFYGYDHFKFSFSSSEVKQQFKNINAKLEFAKINDTAEGMHYFAKVGGYFLGDSYSNSENHLDAFAGLAYSKGNYGFNLKADIQNNILTTSPGKFNTSIGRLKPGFSFVNDLFRLELGLNIAYELGDRNQAYIFPEISLDYQLSDLINVYGGIKGDIIQNTFKNLVALNPYLLPSNGTLLNNNFNLVNTKQSILIYAGIKGNISPEMNYLAQIDVSQVDRLPFLVNTLSTPDNFTLVYDGNNTGVAKLYGEINYLPSDQFRLNANITLQNFHLNTIPKPYYSPGFKLEAIGYYNPIKNWYFNGTIKWVGSQYIPVINNPGTGVVSIEPYFDMSLGIEYRVTKKLGVFLQGNNLYDKQYLIYYNYPVIGLNVLGGLCLRF